MLANSQRFIIRKEYFGALVFDKEANDYIPFDKDACDIFEQSQKKTLEEIYQERSSNVTRQSFDTFVQLCESIGLMENGQVKGAFLDTKRVEGLNQLSAPLKLHLQLTRYCNLSCRHCWAEAGQARDNELTLMDLKKLFDDMVHIGCMKLRLGGGEPFGHSQILEVLEYCQEKGLCVTVSSNGILVSKALAKKLKNVALSEVKVSIDAGSEKNYDYLRGDRGYRKALRGTEYLKEIAEKKVYWHTILHKENVNEVPAIAKLAEKHNIDRVVFDIMFAGGRAKNISHLVLSAEESLHALDLVRRIDQNSRVKLEIPGRIPPVYRKKYLHEGFGSHEGIESMYVASNGLVSPSGPMLERLESGDIRKQSLREIWQDHKVFRALRQNPGNPTCLECGYFGSCRGGSRTRAVIGAGSLTEPDPFCHMVSNEDG